MINITFWGILRLPTSDRHMLFSIMAATIPPLINSV